MELQTTRRIGEIPRSWDQGGGHDPTVGTHDIKEHSATSSEQGLSHI